MTTVLRFGIALYSPLKEGEVRHWALVVSRPGDTSFDGKVNVFQIVHTKDGQGYETFHKSAALAKSGRYYGLVDLGSVKNLIEDQVLGEIEEQPAEQDGYDIPDGKNWSCTWWVIRTLRVLVKDQVPISGLPESDLELYSVVVGPLAENMPEAPAPLHIVSFN
jgi:hypothetical protein